MNHQLSKTQNQKYPSSLQKPFKYVLSGTPKTESDLDYIQQLLFCDDILPFKDFWEFRAKKCHPSGFHKYVLNRNYIEEFKKVLKENCFFMSRQQAGYITNKIYQQRTLTPEKAFYTVYNRAMKDFVLSFKDTNETTIFTSDRFHWLRRLCSGFVENKVHFGHKFKECKYLLETEFYDQQCIVFCEYRDEIELLQKILLRDTAIITGADKQSARDEYAVQFQKGSIKQLIIQSGTMKYGQDLSAGSVCIYFSSPFGEVRLQTEDRLISLKKKDSVLYIDLTVENTIEEEIYQAARTNQTLNQLAFKMLHNRSTR